MRYLRDAVLCHYYNSDELLCALFSMAVSSEFHDLQGENKFSDQPFLSTYSTMALVSMALFSYLRNIPPKLVLEHYG